MKPLRSSYPVGHICNPATRYVPAAKTDIRQTIKRIQREQRAQSLPDIFERTNDEPKRAN